MSDAMNIKAGDCIDCGNYWTVSAGGLNDDGQCPECERKYSGTNETHELEYELAAAGTGLGV